MSFAWPLVLLGLLAIPLLVLLDVRARRRRPRFAVAFTNVDLLRDVVAATSSWRRPARLALALAALSALIVGLARPQLAVSVPKRDATVVLAMDTSGSMVADDVPPSRLGAATAAAESFADSVPSTFDIGLVQFSTTANEMLAPTRDRTAVRDALQGLTPGGGTAIGDAITRALDATRTGTVSAQARAKGEGGRVILLLSDGANTSGVDPLEAAREAKAEGVRVFTIAFGTQDGVVSDQFGRAIPVPPDPDTLAAVAEATGGQSFQASDEASLRRVYQRIGTRVGSTKERHDVSWAFAGGALALALAAGALSIRGRSPLT